MGDAVFPSHLQPLTPERDRIQRFRAGAELVQGAPLSMQEPSDRVQSSCTGSESAVVWKVVFITGAAPGVRRAIGRKLSPRDASVAMCFRDGAASPEELGDEIQQLGCNCQIFRGELSDRVRARKLTREMLDCFRRINAFVHTAGTTPHGSVRKLSNEEWLAQ